MSQITIPWYYQDTLRQHFSDDLDAAVESSRISADQKKWLQRLIDEQDSPTHSRPLPRVDRLLSNTGEPLSGALSSAWMISDPQDNSAPVFLCTVLDGIQSFVDRQSLLQALNQRFQAHDTRAPLLEADLITGNLFTQRMRGIVEQQAGHLERLHNELDRLPSLEKAIGYNLQRELDQRLSRGRVDVFEHCLHLLADDDKVAGTQTLADAAFQDHATGTANLDPGQRRRFLDARGAVLDEQQAEPWVSALAHANRGLLSACESLLDGYWNAHLPDGMSLREYMSQALIESFAHELMRNKVSDTLSTDALRRLSGLLHRPHAAPDPLVCSIWQPSLVLNDSTSCKLAGSFVVLFKDEPDGLYMYSTTHGFNRFSGIQALNEYFKNAAALAKRLSLISIDVHRTLHDHSIQSVELERIRSPLFPAMLQSIIDLQWRNLAHVLSMQPIHYQRAAVRVDDALDIRQCIDRRLPMLQHTWRWSASKIEFAKRWADIETTAEFTAENLDLVLYEPGNTWGSQLESLYQAVDAKCQLHERVVGSVTKTLNLYLAVQGSLHMDVADLAVQIDSQVNLRLISLALERVCGRATGPLPDSARVVASDPARLDDVPNLPIDLLEWILERVSKEFVQRYKSMLRSFFSRPLRWFDNQVRPLKLDSHIRECALRQVLAIARTRKHLDVQSLDMFQQVLDRPSFKLREAMGARLVDVYTMDLIVSPNLAPMTLANTLVLIHPEMPDACVMWSMVDGMSRYESIQALEESLTTSMHSPSLRLAWLEQLPTEARTYVKEHFNSLEGPLRVKVNLSRVVEPVIQILQRIDIERHYQDSMRLCEQSMRRKLPWNTLRDVLGESECDSHNRFLLERIGSAMNMMASEVKLPGWIKNVPLEQLRVLSWLVERWFVASMSGENYLFDLPDPAEYSRARLLPRLQADFPDHNLDPDMITVTVTHYITESLPAGQTPYGAGAVRSRQSSSLTDYAVGRFPFSIDGLLTVSLSSAEKADNPLTMNYVRDLVEDLDLGAGYRALLARKFKPGTEEYLKRRTCYVEQVTPLAILRNYAMLLKDEVSPDAFLFLQSVLSMPDGIARQPVKGRDIIISPLQLRASPNWTPHTVLGVFIIAPRAPAPGRWVIYTLFNSDYQVREFDSEAALLAAIHTDSDFQKMLLERLPAHVRYLYEYGGFREPHLPVIYGSDFDMPSRPAPVTIVVEPIKGNALHAMFDSTAQLLQWWFAQLSVTNAEARSADTRFLWSMGTQLLMTLLPGRLGMLLGAWQSVSLLESSIRDARKMEWSQASAELLSAIGALILVRQTREEEMVLTESESPTETVTGAESESGPASAPAPEWAIETQVFAWGNNSLTPELWARLRTLQATDVALSSMVKDPILNNYRDTASGNTYIVLSGAVFHIEKDANGWRIVGGPRVSLHADGWRLDLKLGLSGGGGTVSYLRSSVVEMSADDLIVYQSSSMAEIRRLWPERAEKIREAHTLAREYLENCIDNLQHRNPDGTAALRGVQTILADFFDAPGVSAQLHEMVLSTVRKLYCALTDASLSPINSERYVIGQRKSLMEDISAFVYPRDPRKRLYMTERFFRDPPVSLRSSVVKANTFHPGPHSRAATMLHELTHLFCATEDIAYLDATMPFTDLLASSSAYYSSVRNDIVRRQHGLSYRTPRHELFRVQREDGNWYDISDKAARKLIFKITGVSKLEKARDIFYADVHKRAKIILGNADSLALLVTLLGREAMAG
ncbi:M35 family metallopeptidase [Pseudomonas cichorii]|nr:M35 family metallopeptidase [Pseudomonas cichorii]MBX8536370.1 M35 family metallopeptidase [Pseudomonas cichorii]